MPSRCEMAVSRFVQIAKDTLENDFVFSGLQRSLSDGDLEFPSIVFVIVGEGTVDSYSGSYADTTIIRYDIRAKDSAKLYELDADLTQALRSNGLVITDSGAVDLFEDALGVYRRSRTITTRG